MSQLWSEVIPESEYLGEKEKTQSRDSVHLFADQMKPLWLNN